VIRTLRSAVIRGDGIGPEVIDATLPVMVRAAALEGVTVEVTHYDWGADRYLREGSVMPDDGAQLIREHDAVLFGAVGRPDVPDHELVRGLIVALRQELDLAVNLRPIKALPGAPSAKADADVDMLIVRENSEGEYLGIGGRAFQGTPRELSIEASVHTRAGVERAARYAFEQAGHRRGSVTLASKANVLRYGFTLWDEVVAEVAAELPDVQFDMVLVDALAARFVEAPESFDVVLCSNLFGDVLADLAAVYMGGLGMAPSANILPGGDVPGVFEPIHGSAPDIAGTGVANPSACLLSAALLLEHCGVEAAAHRVTDALHRTLAAGCTTPDLGGTETTGSFAAAILEALEAAPEVAARA
jgi:tartrate dehydrogenase/decarboxylase/D-malate dehydrogenase